MIVDRISMDSASAYAVLLSVISTVVVVGTLVTVFVKCACCDRPQAKAAVPCNALMTSNTVEGVPEPEPAENHETSGDGSPKRRLSMTRSRTDVIEISAIKSLYSTEDSVVHGRTPSQIRAAFHMQQDQVAKAAIEDIEVTPPNEIDPLPTMPSLPPPSLEARLGKSVARSTKASPSLHYLDVKMEKKHGRLKSYTPDSRSRSTATASITKRSTASFLKLSSVRRKTSAIKKRAASLRKTAPLKTVPAIKSVKSIKSVRTKASPIVKTASFRVPSRRASPAASVTAKEIFVVDSKGKRGEDGNSPEKK